MIVSILEGYEMLDIFLSILMLEDVCVFFLIKLNYCVGFFVLNVNNFNVF